VFCNIINENKKNDIYNICIGYINDININQIDIIRNTYNLILQTDKIPLPKEIYNNIIIININPYIFREFIKYCKQEQLYLNIINKFKIFFTNAIDLNKIKSKRFPLKYKIEKLNIDYIKSNKDLLDIDKNIKNLYKKFTHSIYIYNE
jgi:hypothetical protein